MTMEKRKLWYEGKDLWFEYERVNDYSFTYSKQGIKKLSRLLDLNEKYIEERINIYLNN